MTNNPSALRLLRRLLSLSLEEVATATAIHKSTLSSLERSTAKPSRKLSTRLCKFYSVKQFDDLTKPINAKALADAVVGLLNKPKESSNV